MRGAPAAALGSSELPTAPVQPVDGVAGPWLGPTPGLVAPSRFSTMPRLPLHAAAGQLAAGQRAVRDGPVGYLGLDSDLTVLNPGDTPPTGMSWDGFIFRINSDNFTLDHYWVKAGLWVFGNNCTVRDCRVSSGAGTLYGVVGVGASNTLTVTDTTVTITGATGASYAVNSISCDGILIARRCEVSGSGDGIHFNAGGSIVSQCHVYGLASVDAAQHLDGLQEFNTPVGGSFLVEHNYVDTPEIGPAGVSSCFTSGTEIDTDPLVNGTINNNWFGHGAFNLRLNHRMQNMIVTDNDFEANLSSEFGLVSVFDPASVITWHNNRDPNGQFIAQP